LSAARRRWGGSLCVGMGTRPVAVAGGGVVGSLSHRRVLSFGVGLPAARVGASPGALVRLATLCRALGCWAGQDVWCALGWRLPPSCAPEGPPLLLPSGGVDCEVLRWMRQCPPRESRRSPATVRTRSLRPAAPSGAPHRPNRLGSTPGRAATGEAARLLTGAIPSGVCGFDSRPFRSRLPAYGFPIARIGRLNSREDIGAERRAELPEYPLLHAVTHPVVASSRGRRGGPTTHQTPTATNPPSPTPHPPPDHTTPPQYAHPCPSPPNQDQQSR
jgi:hypothetical protein